MGLFKRKPKYVTQEDIDRITNYGNSVLKHMEIDAEIFSIDHHIPIEYGKKESYKIYVPIPNIIEGDVVATFIDVIHVEINKTKHGLHLEYIKRHVTSSVFDREIVKSTEAVRLANYVLTSDDYIKKFIRFINLSLMAL